MDKLGSQKDQAHEMLVRHHECTQEMEFRHLDMIQKMRLDHQKTQQSTEWSNQMEYNKRAELDLKRRHLMEQKQQPKTLKVASDIENDGVLIFQISFQFYFISGTRAKDQETVPRHSKNPISTIQSIPETGPANGAEGKPQGIN